ncbi:MAG: hypothetical protein HDS11_04185 [Bacteroides sp.]|nr:hypothetical protein [Bacteroides sp.]
MKKEKIFDDVHFATYLGNKQRYYYEKSKTSLNGEDAAVAKVLLEVMKQYNREYH